MAILHSVFGLRLISNRLIPGLLPLPAVPPVDVHVWLGTLPLWWRTSSDARTRAWYASSDCGEHGKPNLRVWQLPGGHFRWLYDDDTECFIDPEGKEIWLNWPESYQLEDTIPYLLGQVLGFVQRLRGVTCLHASAVVLGKQAAAFMGPAGSGKSTMAAALSRLGYGVLSDDVVPIQQVGQIFLAQSAYPRLWLRPDIVGAFYGSADALPLLAPTWDKRYVDLGNDDCSFRDRPERLAAIYVLGERSRDSKAPFVDEGGAKENLVALVANTYGNHLLDRGMRAREFEFLGRLVRGVPFRRVIPHAEPKYLPRLCEVIVDDFQALSPRALTASQAPA